MKISIITPCLNSEKTLKFNLKSVLTQDYKNIEHIILEKYSSDKNPAYNLEAQVNTGVLKLFSDSNDKKKNIDVILKISGLWEDNMSYGITYKFLSVL